MECGKVVICRLRSTEYYKGENLQHIVDSHYYLLNNYIETKDEWPVLGPFDCHNVSLPAREKSRKTIRNLSLIENCDTLIIPSEAEFAYNIYGRISNLMMGRTWGLVQDIREALKRSPKKRKLVILSSDKADTKELYRNKVFKGIPFEIYRIDESEFPGGIHHLKYLNIKKLNLDTTKDKDFVYWGTSKKFKIDITSQMKDYLVKDYYNESGERTGKHSDKLKVRFTEPCYIGKSSEDERHIILKQIRDSNVKDDMIGYFDGFKYTRKFDKKMTNILPFIAKANTTLCFNWPGQEEHLTSRYNEALGCDVIPLVWKDYDCNNQLVVSDWQRCYSFEDVQKKCLEVQDNQVRLLKLKEIKDKYSLVVKDLEYYENLFNKKMDDVLYD